MCENETHVYNSRRKNGGVWRRRECPNCLTRFSTFETILCNTLDEYVQKRIQNKKS
ncbi:hypothetical protein [Bacillus marasmi]|uniref:NrdR family transcriptional regulator n=1 Tax=Bacillus marasmi TaxID=1926279 RepID=UPI003CCC610D